MRAFSAAAFTRGDDCPYRPAILEPLHPQAVQFLHRRCNNYITVEFLQHVRECGDAGLVSGLHLVSLCQRQWFL